MRPGVRMTLEFAAAQGRVVGSDFKLSEIFLAISLLVPEIVSKRKPPARNR